VADSQRQIQQELQQNTAPSPDDLRRLAGEKEQLAERVRRLERSVDDLESQAGQAEQRKVLDAAARELSAQQIERRLRESASALRQEAATEASAARPPAAGQASQPAGKGGSQPGTSPGRATARMNTEQELTRALDGIAERMAAALGEHDGETRELSAQLARTRDLKERLADLERQMTAGAQGQGRGKPADSRSSSPGGNGGDAADRASARDEFVRQLQEARRLLGSSKSAGGQESGLGGTPEQWEPSVSAPGTEAFKQDFSQWEVLRRDVTLALERLEASLSSRLQEKHTRDRLSAGADDRAPESYQRLVDEYFRSLASNSNR
jgi:hypothetical protein